MNLEQAVAIVKPHNDRILADARVEKLEREKGELVAALQAMVINMKNDGGEYRDCFKAAERALARTRS